MRTVTLTLVLLLSACAGGPVGYAGPTTRPRPDAYACATEQLTALGYTVESANRETGQIRGSRQLPGVVASIEPGKRHFSQMQVTVTQEGAAPVTLRTTPTMLRETGVRTPFGWSTIPGDPDQGGILDANTILIRCGVADTAIRAG
jgi:hypothetical protein